MAFSSAHSSSHRRIPPRISMSNIREFVVGQSVVVKGVAGPRLSGKRGTVLGLGATRTRVRVLLDGSKGPITMHASFLEGAELL
jgi:hypothetical protein